MRQLFTVGYEAAGMEEFIGVLRDAGVTCLIDVRQLPISRRRGFSKGALAQTLALNGIDYVHVRSLGDPKPGREAARAGRYAEFRHIFASHLRTPGARQGLQIVANMAKRVVACLMCYEKSAELCHRSIIAAALAKIECVRVEHLKVAGADQREAEKAIARARRGSRARQSRAAAEPATW